MEHIEVTVEVPAAEPEPTAAPDESVAEHGGEVVPDAPTPEAAPAAPTSPEAIFREHNLEDWLLEEGLGTEAFKDETTFRIAFQQYVSSHGGNPNSIEVRSQSTRDAKNGRVIEYVAEGPENWSYAVEYNERLRRIVHHGAR